MAEADTEGIDNVDIVTLVFDLTRAVISAEDVVVPIVGGCCYAHAVVSRDSGRSDTCIRDEREVLRQTEVGGQVEGLRRGENLIAVRVEIRRICAHHHTSEELFADQVRPYVFGKLHSVMIVKDNRIVPFLGDGIRQNDIVVVCYDDCRDLEGSSIGFVDTSIELVRSRIVLNESTLGVVRTHLERQRVRMINRIFLFYISLGF